MHSKHLTTPTQALFHVFVLPALSHTKPTRTPPAPQLAQPSSRQRSLRPFSSSTTFHAKNSPAEVRRELWNDEIRSREIFLLSAETGRPAERPIRRDDILNRIDLRNERLVQVAPGIKRKGVGEYDQDEFIPIPLCKVVNKRDEYDRQKQLKENAKEKSKISAVTHSIKTIELNWAIDGNDLGHRIEKIKQFLNEGRKVEVVLAAKKRGRKASPEECRTVLSRIRGAAEEVGGREAGAMEGKLGGFTMMRFQGKMPQGREE